MPVLQRLQQRCAAVRHVMFLKTHKCASSTVQVRTVKVKAVQVRMALRERPFSPARFPGRFIMILIISHVFSEHLPTVRLPQQPHLRPARSWQLPGQPRAFQCESHLMAMCVPPTGRQRESHWQAMWVGRAGNVSSTGRQREFHRQAMWVPRAGNVSATCRQCECVVPCLELVGNILVASIEVWLNETFVFF